jgi:hypothetical protein
MRGRRKPVPSVTARGRIAGARREPQHHTCTGPADAALTRTECVDAAFQARYNLATMNPR